MKTKVMWALIALNVLLLVGLVAPFGFNRTAHAQAAAAAGRPSEYMMISGDVIGGNSQLIYIIDEENQQLSAMTLDQNGRTLDFMPPIDLKRVFIAGAAGAGAAGGGRP